MDPLERPLATATDRSGGYLSDTILLVQGRLWSLIDAALSQKDNMITFSVVWLGKIIVSTDTEQDAKILKYPRYSEKTTGGHAWDTFAEICFGSQNLIMTSGDQHKKLAKAFNPLFKNSERYYNDLKDVTRSTLAGWVEKSEFRVLDAALEHSCKCVTASFLGREAAESTRIITAVKDLMDLFWDNAQMKPWAVMNLLGRKIFGKCCNLDSYWESHQILIEAIENARMSAPEGSFIKKLDDDFSYNELIDNMKMLYFAGTETTGSLITTALGYLAQNQEEQNKLRAEIEKEDLSYETLHKLKRLKAFVFECLRLVPPIPIQVRGVKADGGNYSYFIDHFHRLRDSDVVGENPEIFNVERFFNNEDLFSEVEKVFGGGLTPCIGKHFALTETLLLIASVVLQGNVTLIEGDPTEVIKEAGAHLSPTLKIQFSPNY